WDRGRLRRVTDPGYEFIGPPSLNAAGDVAFWGWRTDGTQGIFVSVNNNRVVTVASGRFPLVWFGTPVLSPAGTVVFERRDPNGFQELIASDAKGRQHAILDTNGPYDAITEALSINADDAVVFLAHRRDANTQ